MKNARFRKHPLRLSRRRLRNASFTIVSGQPEITRENLLQVVDVTARLNGRGLGAGIADVRHALAKPGILGPGITYTGRAL